MIEPFNPNIKKDGLKGASKGYYLISMEKLEENRQLYDEVMDRIGNKE